MTDLATITITRKELYERVWGKPLVHLCREFGLSGAGFAKLCRRNQIPVPFKGFWNLFPENRKAQQPVLPEADRVWKIEIKPSPGGFDKVKKVPAKVNRIVVPDELLRPHSLIRWTRGRLREQPIDSYGRYVPGAGCLHILVTVACRQRAYRIMNTVLKECEARGWKVAFDDEHRGGTVVTVNGGEVPVMLEEMLRREPRELTPSEKAEEVRRGEPFAYPVYARFPSGKLMLRLGAPTASGRVSWKEWRRTRLENLLDSFMAGLAEAGVRRKEQVEAKVKAAEEKRQNEIASWKLAEACGEERARVDDLVASAESWNRSQTIRAYVNAVEAQFKTTNVEAGCEPAVASEMENWIAWARKQADRLDPLTESPPSVLDQQPFTFHVNPNPKNDWWGNVWRRRMRKT